MLEIKNIVKRYAKFTAVNDFSLTIDDSEIIGLLGANGAGKSTLISLISTIMKPTSGDILYNSKSIFADDDFKKIIGVVPQEIALYENLSGMDNLKFFASAYGLKSEQMKEKIDEVIAIIKLEDKIDKKVSTYSGGMKRRLNIAVALLNSPKLLIMDEATVGIDPQSRNFILETVKMLNRTGMGVIYSTHYMQEIVRLGAKLLIIDRGKQVAYGKIQDIMNEYNLDKDMDLEDVFLNITGSELRDL